MLPLALLKMNLYVPDVAITVRKTRDEILNMYTKNYSKNSRTIEVKKSQIKTYHTNLILYSYNDRLYIYIYLSASLNQVNTFISLIFNNIVKFGEIRKSANILED